MGKKQALLGKLALLATAIIWGSSFVVFKNTLGSIGALWVLAIRFSIAALIMGCVSFRKIKRATPRCFKGGLLMGAALACAYIVQTYGLVYTTPGKNAFLTSTYCVLTPFFSWAAYRRRPELSHLIAAVLCVAGIGFVSLSEGFSDVNRGDVLTVACGVFYAIQILLTERFRDSGDAATLSAVQFAAAAVICWVGALLFEKAPTAISSETWLSIAYLSVMCTAVCFYLQVWGIRYTPAATAAMIMTLESVFGVLISILFYREIVTAKIAFGFVLIFAAVLISELRPFRDGKSAEGEDETCVRSS
ncbi:MAG: DMT family transporter [Oscillospiraceae bacterium]|nr:DMT family transporter [Oscillospiraceae bacterium]